jgi:hypothetical protein
MHFTGVAIREGSPAKSGTEAKPLNQAKSVAVPPSRKATAGKAELLKEPYFQEILRTEDFFENRGKRVAQSGRAPFDLNY